MGIDGVLNLNKHYGILFNRIQTVYSKRGYHLWCGTSIIAESFEHAEYKAMLYSETHNLKDFKVIGRYVMEIPVSDEEFTNITKSIVNLN